MNIITWNANSTERWDDLWTSPQVSTYLNWDIICLQEAGNPMTNWTLLHGPQWPSGSSHESSVRRYYSYTPPNLPQVYILHCEWPNRQKNHLVIITKQRPTGGADLSGQMGERPAVGIKVRLEWQLNNIRVTRTILFGCVHIVASYKAADEVRAMLQFVNGMRVQFNTDGWLLVGDFNCPAEELWGSLGGAPLAVSYPMQWTQYNNPVAIDYLLASEAWIFSCTSQDFSLGIRASDHRLVSYRQVGGSTVHIV
jgi:endonuclease/exonuclease/phosphatase family metal-dependent hydrolase